MTSTQNHQIQNLASPNGPTSQLNQLDQSNRFNWLWTGQLSGPTDPEPSEPLTSVKYSRVLETEESSSNQNQNPPSGVTQKILLIVLESARTGSDWSGPVRVLMQTPSSSDDPLLDPNRTALDLFSPVQELFVDRTAVPELHHDPPSEPVQNQTRPRTQSSSAASCWLGLLGKIKRMMMVLLFVYISIPFIIKLFPSIQAKLVFLNFGEFQSDLNGALIGRFYAAWQLAGGGVGSAVSMKSCSI
ncbi:hypothetical protein CCH79_00020599 [Gambusia affinis]|uniref:Uncharacterized protein n=1 Tax=Gambusia affinis TaxID=33528 RepID=A0A315VQP7_GAMAF|nr:hypothetical protein CCH79_00020599 [Gambusia affinis]